MKRSIKIGERSIPLWTIVVLLISIISIGVLADYVWRTIIISVEVKEPLEIVSYPSKLTLFPGETEEFNVTVMNHASRNYTVILDFFLDNATYQNNYVTFSDETYTVMPGQQNLLAWLKVESYAPPINASLTIDFRRIGKVLFFDDFDGTSVDTTKWVAELNEGSIKVANSFVTLSSEGYTFPHVYSRTNPFPTTGDFVLEFDLTYLQVTGDGDGFWVSKGIFEPPGFANILQVWQDGLNYGQYRYLRIHLLGNPIYSSSMIDTNRHQYVLKYSHGTYTFYMDGVNLASASSSLRPDIIGFGHPPPYPPPYPVTWTSFKIDKILVYQI